MDALCEQRHRGQVELRDGDEPPALPTPITADRSATGSSAPEDGEAVIRVSVGINVSVEVAIDTDTDYGIRPTPGFQCAAASLDP